MRNDKHNSKIGEGSAENMMQCAGTRQWDIQGTKNAGAIGNLKATTQKL
jgi:hypothetical protein